MASLLSAAVRFFLRGRVVLFTDQKVLVPELRSPQVRDGSAVVVPPAAQEFVERMVRQTIRDKGIEVNPRLYPADARWVMCSTQPVSDLPSGARSCVVLVPRAHARETELSMCAARMPPRVTTLDMEVSDQPELAAFIRRRQPRHQLGAAAFAELSQWSVLIWGEVNPPPSSRVVDGANKPSPNSDPERKRKLSD